MKRLVIFDLDDTLWECDGGCVSFLTMPFSPQGADALSDADGRTLRLMPGTRSLLSWLADRDVLLSIASYNYAEFGTAALAALGILDRFFVPQICVAHKDEMVRRICSYACPQGIRRSDMLFVDDRYSNIARVSQLCVPCLHMGRDIRELGEVRHYLM